MSQENQHPKPVKHRLEPNVMLFQAFAMIAAEKISYTGIKILLQFFSDSGYLNYVYVDIRSLMIKFKLSKQTIVCGLKELEQFNIIIKEKDSNDLRRHNYFINPYTAWKGSSTQRHQMIARLRKSGKDLTLNMGRRNPLPSNEKLEQQFLTSKNESDRV